MVHVRQYLGVKIQLTGYLDVFKKISRCDFKIWMNAVPKLKDF